MRSFTASGVPVRKCQLCARCRPSGRAAPIAKWAHTGEVSWKPHSQSVCAAKAGAAIDIPMGPRSRDNEIRAAAHATLLKRARACPDTIVIDELGLDHGACRVDIAVINGHIRGVEIKADADVLDRLPGQIAAYGAVVDRATLIAAPRHLEKALTLLPEWWGVMSAELRPGGKIVFRIVRPERSNRSVNPLTLSRLLWRPEAASVLRELGYPEKMLRQPREELYRALVAELPKRELAERVRRALKIREVWRDRPEPS